MKSQIGHVLLCSCAVVNKFTISDFFLIFTKAPLFTILLVIKFQALNIPTPQTIRSFSTPIIISSAVQKFHNLMYGSSTCLFLFL